MTRFLFVAECVLLPLAWWAVGGVAAVWLIVSAAVFAWDAYDKGHREARRDICDSWDILYPEG